MFAHAIAPSAGGVRPQLASDFAANGEASNAHIAAVGEWTETYIANQITESQTNPLFSVA